jgi:hypothetical protein
LSAARIPISPLRLLLHFSPKSACCQSIENEI